MIDLPIAFSSVDSTTSRLLGVCTGMSQTISIIPLCSSMRTVCSRRQRVPVARRLSRMSSAVTSEQSINRSFDSRNQEKIRIYIRMQTCQIYNTLKFQSTVNLSTYDLLVFNRLGEYYRELEDK